MSCHNNVLRGLNNRGSPGPRENGYRFIFCLMCCKCTLILSLQVTLFFNLEVAPEPEGLGARTILEVPAPQAGGHK